MRKQKLVNMGSASYIGETIEECKFYETEEDSFKTQ